MGGNQEVAVEVRYRLYLLQPHQEVPGRDRIERTCFRSQESSSFLDQPNRSTTLEDMLLGTQLDLREFDAIPVHRWWASSREARGSEVSSEDHRHHSEQWQDLEAALLWAG